MKHYNRELEDVSKVLNIKLIAVNQFINSLKEEGV
jgi:hypothetical protein